MSEIEATRRLTRVEAADYLREFADELDDRDSDPLSAGLYDETDGQGGEEVPNAPGRPGRPTTA